MPFYAVANGRTTGIYHSWAECESQVKGFSGAKFKKFDTASSAQDFLRTGNYNSNQESVSVRANTSYQANNYYGRASNNLKRSYSESKSYSPATRPPSKPTHQHVHVEYNIAPKQTISMEPPTKKYKPNKNPDFEEDKGGFVQVYTDGACSSNGQQGARAGLGVYWGDNHRLNRSEPVSGRPTNNSGEIQAATRAIKMALENGIDKLAINTDSKFLIKAATEWIPGWKQRGWTLASGEPVKNKADFRELDNVQNKLEIKWNYVKAHDGSYGNEMADKLAKEGAAKYHK